MSRGGPLTLLVGATQLPVRLADIDAPERGQAFGTQARHALAALTFGKRAKVQVVDRDRYGRAVGRVYVDETDVNASLVLGGYAWVYRRYNRDPSLPNLEADARNAGRGLWSLRDPVPPWDWRRGERTGSRAPPVTSPTCGTKRYCREMASCAEARHYLDACGLTRLDGDGDGVPCESICRQ